MIFRQKSPFPKAGRSLSQKSVGAKCFPGLYLAFPWFIPDLFLSLPLIFGGLAQRNQRSK
ncbi:hypothetical protein DWB84_12600 [Saccharophagus sp. K07]|nr:hypothetical protein [Saccharophagus sp. K07]